MSSSQLEPLAALTPSHRASNFFVILSQPISRSASNRLWMRSALQATRGHPTLQAESHGLRGLHVLTWPCQALL